MSCPYDSVRSPPSGHISVALAEHGDDDDIYEYTNDLYCRNWLHDAWILLDDYVLQLWTLRIKAVGDQFRAATVADEGQALRHFHKVPPSDLWWWRRYPRPLAGDVGDSLRCAGAIGFYPDET